MGKLTKKIQRRILSPGFPVFLIRESSHGSGRPQLVSARVANRYHNLFDIEYDGGLGHLEWVRDLPRKRLILSRELAQAEFERRVALLGLEGRKVRIRRNGDLLTAERV